MSALKQSSLKEIFSVLLANPNLGHISVEGDRTGSGAEGDAEPRKAVRVVLHDIDKYLVSFGEHVGKVILWNSMYKRFKRAGFVLQTELGCTRIFDALISQSQLDYLFGVEKSPAKDSLKRPAPPKSPLLLDLADVYQAALHVQLLLKEGPPRDEWWNHSLAPPLACVVMPEPLPPQIGGSADTPVSAPPTSFIE